MSCVAADHELVAQEVTLSDALDRLAYEQTVCVEPPDANAIAVTLSDLDRLAYEQINRDVWSHAD
jgi:hypothetical protein